MRDLEVPIAFLLALEEGDFTRLDRMLAEEMVFCGPLARPMGKLDYLCLMRAVRAGITNWKSHFRDVLVQRPFVSLTTEITGAHLKTLPPLLPGMPAHPPTGASFRLPPERTEFTLDTQHDYRITHIHVDPVPGGGIKGMLEQLGIQVPIIN